MKERTLIPVLRGRVLLLALFGLILVLVSCQSSGGGEGSENTGSRSGTQNDILRRFTGDYELVQDEDGNIMAQSGARTSYDGREFRTTTGDFSGQTKTFRAGGYQGTREYRTGSNYHTGSFRTSESQFDGARSSSTDREYRSSGVQQSRLEGSTHLTDDFRGGERVASGVSGTFRTGDEGSGISDRAYRVDDVSRIRDWRPGEAAHGIPTLRSMLGKD